MLKIRDKADYKALEKLGLVEPDDTNKAIELGFPKRTPKPLTLPITVGDDEPVPMQLPGSLPNMMEAMMNTTTRKSSVTTGLKNLFEL